MASSIPQHLVDLVLLADNSTCVYCGAQEESMTIDHYLAQVKGGPDTFDNLFTCCGSCNRIKKDSYAFEKNMIPTHGRFVQDVNVVRERIDRILKQREECKNSAFTKTAAKEHRRTHKPKTSAWSDYIRILATTRQQDGRYAYSANYISRCVRGTRAEIMAIVRDIRAADLQAA